MILDPKDREALGQYVDMVARTPEEFAKLSGDSNRTLHDLNLYNDDLMDPKTPEIVVHQNTKRIMHMVIPWKGDIDEAKGMPYSYPTQYDPNSVNYIDPSKERERAIVFRIGDYTLNSCM